MSDLKPVGDPRVIAGIEVQYVSSSTHSHEGGHRLTVNGRTVLALPDGHTTARQRSHAISEALQETDGHEPAGFYAVVGALVVSGARNIEIDGRPLLTDNARTVASLRLDVTQIGDAIDIAVAHLGDN